MLPRSNQVLRPTGWLRPRVHPGQVVLPPSRRCPPQSVVQQMQRRSFNAKDRIRPYSDSLPSPGYEWCERCQIRTHKFQKPRGYHNTCLDAPRLFGWGVCGPARQYYQQQVTHMIFLSLFCFAAAPLYNNATHTQQDVDN